MVQFVEAEPAVVFQINSNQVSRHLLAAGPHGVADALVHLRRCVSAGCTELVQKCGLDVVPHNIFDRYIAEVLLRRQILHKRIVALAAPARSLDLPRVDSVGLLCVLAGVDLLESAVGLRGHALLAVRTRDSEELLQHLLVSALHNYFQGVEVCFGCPPLEVPRNDILAAD